MENMQQNSYRRFDPPVQIASDQDDAKEVEAHRNFRFERKSGYCCIAVNGWGIRYKDVRRRLPDYDERIGTIKSLKLGPFWFSIVRPQ